ncbi:MAG TPA: M1 family aminopeptidase [Kofleriaceae bacterium]|nr:M1 family aminopeptidase [Kofleriaceae bacterium]
MSPTRAGWSSVFIALLLASACGARDPESGVAGTGPRASDPPRASDAPAGDAPALRLPRGAAPLRYRASLEVDPSATSFRGHIEIDVTVKRAADRLWLNAHRLTVEKAVLRRGGADTPLTAAASGRSFLSLAGAIPAGESTLVLDYTGVQDVGLSNGMSRYTEAGDWYVVTHFEPDDARRVFPSFDEPGFKVPWQVDLTVPAKMVGFSNTAVEREETLPDGRRHFHFRATRPLPSYLIAIAVGPFETVDAGATRTGVPTRIVVPRGRSRDAASAVAEVGKVLAALEDYTGIPYAYDKLDHMVVPGTQRGAMEHPGLVTYGPRWLLIRPGESVAAVRGQVGIVAHELAHQWFGDLVTTAWWDDIWLNEAFATWMAPKVITSVHPEMDGLVEPVSSRAVALAADSLASARQIRHPIAVETDMKAAFDRITYSKGATVIGMFERWVGPDRFREAARAYLHAHADRNATAADFLAALDRTAGKPGVGAAFATFLDQPGVPEIAMELRCPAGGPASLGLGQHRYLPAGAPKVAGEARWQVPVCVKVPEGGRLATHCALLGEASGEIALGATCPAWVLPNADGAGYYLGVLAAEPLTALLDRGWSKLSRPERIAVVNDLDILVDGGEAELGVVLALLPRLGGGKDPYLVDLAIGRLEKLSPFVAAAQRDGFARLVRATLGRAGRRIGWTPRRREDLADARMRGKLMALLAVDGRDAGARAGAVSLARRWLADHDKVPESLWTSVLQTAVRVNPEIGPALLARVGEEQDRVAQRAMYQALAVTPDPALQRRALERALAVDPIPPELVQLLGTAPVEIERQASLSGFVREHADDLIRRLPEDYQGSLLAPVCDAGQRDEVVAFLEGKLAALPDVGPLGVKQKIEWMDQCIARRAAQAPALGAYLSPKK